jgi:flagellar assembly protein FliH
MPVTWYSAEKAMTLMYNKPTLACGPDAEKFSSLFPGAMADQAPVKLSAWQRWEMTSIAADLKGAVGGNDAFGFPLEPIKPVVLVDDAELVQLRLLAQEAGNTAGYCEGYERGLAEGHASGLAAVQAQAMQLQTLTQDLTGALRGAEHELADDLLALALDLARQVLGQALKTEPQAMLTVVRELLQAEPALLGMPQLLLHPEDAALVKEHLPDELQAAGWRIRVDATLQRGGCRVLASSGELDATLPTRWERVAAALVRNVTPATTLSDSKHD